MLKFFSSPVLYVGLALCGFMFSCQQDSIEEISQDNNAALTKDELVKAMVEDEQVQQFILNNEAFLNKFDAWYGDLTVDERKQFNRASEEALRNGKTIEDKSMTPEETSIHHKKQEDLAAAIKAKYPSLYELNVEEQTAIRSSVRELILGKSKARQGAKVQNDCHDGYNACSWSCYDNNGGQVCYDSCKAGYYACTKQ